MKRSNIKRKKIVFSPGVKKAFGNPDKLIKSISRKPSSPLKKAYTGYTEHQIQTQIIHYLQATGWYVMRLNTGKYSIGEGKYKRFVMGQEKGTPDLVAFKKYKNIPILGLWFIEVKRPGKEPERAQVMKMNELEQYGAQCLVAHSIEEVQEVLG